MTVALNVCWECRVLLRPGSSQPRVDVIPLMPTPTTTSSRDGYVGLPQILGSCERQTFVGLYPGSVRRRRSRGGRGRHGRLPFDEMRTVCSTATRQRERLSDVDLSRASTSE